MIGAGSDGIKRLGNEQYNTKLKHRLTKRCERRKEIQNPTIGDTYLGDCT